MAFCANCGHKVEEYDKFCPQCGVATRKDYFTNSNNKTGRKESYDGEIKKCPNCGEILNSFTPNCPTCGYELRNSKSTNYILEFSRKLESASTAKQKDDLIRHFVMPNTKEDIYEFMILASANLEAGGDNTDAWLIKLEQAHQKAKLMFGDSPDIQYINDIYNNATNNYKKIKRNNRVNTIGNFISKHWFGILLMFLGTSSFLLIILGSVFHVGVVEYDTTHTTGHLWWKKEEVEHVTLHVMAYIGVAMAIITIYVAMIVGSTLSDRKNKMLKKSKSSLNESDET